MSRHAVHRAANSTAITRLTHSAVVGVEQVYVLPLWQAIGHDKTMRLTSSPIAQQHTCLEPFMGI